MDHYHEYNIRCMTCGANVASKSYSYIALLNQGLTVEVALNELGIMRYCCRKSFMSPTVVFMNMENRPLIEGFKTLDQVSGPDATTVHAVKSVFTACIDPKQPVNGGVTITPSQNSVGPKGTGINVGEAFDLSNFELPTTITFPTINRDNSRPMEMMYVGADKESAILDGRTYLAK